MEVEDIRFHKKIMNLNYYFSSRHVRKKSFSFVYFVVLGNLTDLCLTWTWFLMISGNPSSKRVWLKIRPMFDTKYMHRVKGIDILIGYAVACWSSWARVQEFLSGKLQVSKVLGGGPLFSRWSTC